MKPSLVNQRLFALGWTPGLLSKATGIPVSEISRVIHGRRQTMRVQEAIVSAVRFGNREARIAAHPEVEGWKLFGALWFACQRIA